MAKDVMPVYKRIILKLSGGVLTGQEEFGLDPAVLDRFAQDLYAVHQLGVEVGVVIGGGNLFRGAALSQVGIDRITADQMGMLSTVINALALRDALVRAGAEATVMSAIPIPSVVDHFDRRHAIESLQQKKIVLFAFGTGNPLVTTDSAASLRGIEVGADVLLKATNVDGVYEADPAKHPNAKRFSQLTYQQVLEQELGVMDLAAFCQCRDHGLPIRVFDITVPGILQKIILGEPEGTLVDKE